MATKKTAGTTKTAPAKNASAKKPAAKKQPATKTAKTTTAKNPASTKTANQKMSQIDAALAVLKKARKPMSCREMVEAMAKQKLWTSPGGKTPDATLYAAILRDLRKGTDTRFKKAASGRFTMK
ncbi:winged helix-turn-helix domain-containing protein [Roseiconus lacunae]|uniref:winged helix-turn-helix domain-containing protein n=1 Tax=Roseiconus lacunae TaxID=2605694 RepID=UPI0011F2B9CB|nr:winged helix-turn-helix domain-containing protein [Roseiconus lacunae]